MVMKVRNGARTCLDLVPMQSSGEAWWSFRYFHIHILIAASGSLPYSMIPRYGKGLEGLRGQKRQNNLQT